VLQELLLLVKRRRCAARQVARHLEVREPLDDHLRLVGARRPERHELAAQDRTEHTSEYGAGARASRTSD
jgi:hypothetical protein